MPSRARITSTRVQTYNTELVTFPGVLWASTFYSSYKPAASFTADAGAATAPKVNFGTDQTKTNTGG